MVHYILPAVVFVHCTNISCVPLMRHYILGHATYRQKFLTFLWKLLYEILFIFYLFCIIENTSYVHFEPFKENLK